MPGPEGRRVVCPGRPSPPPRRRPPGPAGKPRGKFAYGSGAALEARAAVRRGWSGRTSPEGLRTPRQPGAHGPRTMSPPGRAASGRASGRGRRRHRLTAPRGRGHTHPQPRRRSGRSPSWTPPCHSPPPSHTSPIPPARLTGSCPSPGLRWPRPERDSRINRRCRRTIWRASASAMELGKYNRGRSIFMRDWGGGSRLGRSCGEGGKERASERARRRRRGTRTCTARGGPWRRGGGVPRAGPDLQATPTPWPWPRPRPWPQHAWRPQRQRSPQPTPADLGVSSLSAFPSWSLSGPACTHRLRLPARC